MSASAILSTSSFGAGPEQTLEPPSFTDPDRRAKLESAFPELDRLAARWAEERDVPGLAWGVVIDGELAKFGSVGVSDLEAEARIDEDTVFRIASMTKSFTAVAILKLRDEGLVDLDAPIARYIPELASLALSDSRLRTDHGAPSAHPHGWISGGQSMGRPPDGDFGGRSCRNGCRSRFPSRLRPVVVSSTRTMATPCSDG